MAFLSNSCRLLVFKFCSDVQFYVCLYFGVFP
jgi:hypothetical protein